jgi:MFS family permease
MLPATAVTLAALLLLAVLLKTGVPDPVLVLPTFVAGFSYVSVGSLVRARWSRALGDRPELSTAYSVESVLDELIFVVGPLVATVVATHADPVDVLYISAALIGVGTVWLAAQRATEPPRHPPDAPRHRSALREPGMVLLTVTTAAMGALFASAELSTVAFCGQHGRRALSGVVLALIAGGSATSGLLYGSRRWRADVLTRYRLQSVVFAFIPALFLLAVNIPVLAVCGFVVGLAISPTLITAFGLVERLVPSTSLTEGLAWLLTGLNLGYGAGSAVVGGIADAHGARTAFAVAVVAGLTMGALALVLHRRLSLRHAAEPVPVCG